MTTMVKMSHLQDNVGFQVTNPTKNKTNFIEWNVDMRVTISNVKRSKIFQRSRNFTIFLLVIIVAVVLSHLKREIRALQVQMQYMNVNLLVLMSKYDKLNRDLNRIGFYRNTKFDKSPNIIYSRSVRHSEKISSDNKTPEILNTMENSLKSNASFYAHDASAAYVNRTVNTKVKGVYDTINAKYSNVDMPNLPLIKSLDIVHRNKRDSTGKVETDLNVKNLNAEKIDMQNRNEKNETTHVLTTRKESRSSRLRRDDGRGKKWRKNKGPPKRSRRRLGPQIATFVGAIPEQHITDTFYIGPWIKSIRNDSQYNFNKFHLVEDKKSIEVTTSGLYMISVQIFYFGEQKNYSYWILLTSEGASATQKLVKCATASAISAAEVSCHTSVIQVLHRGDRLHVQQQERNRLINMREGHSYIQLALLSNVHRKC